MSVLIEGIFAIAIFSLVMVLAADLRQVGRRLRRAEQRIHYLSKIVLAKAANPEKVDE